MWSQFTNTNFNKIKINKFNKSFIKSIKLIRKDIINMRDIDFKYFITIIPNNKINSLKSSFWVSDNLIYDDLLFEVNIKWNNNNIYMKTNQEKFNKFLNRLPIFLKLINYININNENIEIYMILSNLKKYIDENNIIMPHHINSGYTNLTTKEIFIWREEEFEKVCFHELIHLMNRDHRHENINIDTNIKGPESYFEAITDFKAIIFNLIYLSLNTKIKIKILYGYEYSFIKNQAFYINDMLNIFNEQKSPAYSYYILKYFIFKYFNNNFNEILFNNIFYRNINYKQLINIIKKYKIINNNYISTNSARMTLFELH